MSEIKKANCKICNGNVDFVFSATENMHGTGESFQYGKCVSCGCVQILNPPDDLSKYYQTYYGRNPISEDNLSFKLRKLRFLNDFNKPNFFGEVLSYFFEDPAPKSLNTLNLNFEQNILDIGCADGFLLYMLKECGYKNVLGVDPEISESIKYKNGLEIIKGNLQAIKDKSFDVIMLHHVLEHIENQSVILNEIYSLLKPNGLLLIRIPTSTSFAFANYKENWYQVDAPRHLFLHSHESIKSLLEESNFKIDRLYSDSTIWQFICSEEYKKGIPFVNHMKNYITKLPFMLLTGLFWKYKLKVKRLNEKKLGDQIVIMARKCA